MSWLLDVFCCCRIRTSNKHPESIDENTQLIPNTTEPLYVRGPHLLADNQHIKERLGDIVRSTKGKMVNLGAQLPFNLRHHTFVSNPTSSASWPPVDRSMGADRHGKNEDAPMGAGKPITAEIVLNRPPHRTDTLHLQDPAAAIVTCGRSSLVVSREQESAMH